MFMGIQHESALTEMPFYLLLDLVRLELRSASELIQPVSINLGRPSFEFDSAHVKYGVWTEPKKIGRDAEDNVNEKMILYFTYESWSSKVIFLCFLASKPSRNWTSDRAKHFK